MDPSKTICSKSHVLRKYFAHYYWCQRDNYSEMRATLIVLQLLQLVQATLKTLAAYSGLRKYSHIFV